MDDSMAGVVLAAGAGTRLAPLTHLRPKALCPVACRPLVDHALDRLTAVSGDVAVNLHHGVEALDDHLPASVHRSVESPVALGTAGGLGALRRWLDGRDACVTNGDAWFGPGLDLEPFLVGWDRERVRLLCVKDPARGDFGSRRYCGVALMPWVKLQALAAEPSGLYERSWRQELDAGRLDLVVHTGPFVDCATTADYLAANLAASGGAVVVDPSAVVGAGAQVTRSVVWDHSEVAPGEVLVDAVRAAAITVLVR
ncbi:MAG: NTP transferase domain-containing protein [Acidimicrobiales bacterium]